MAPQTPVKIILGTYQFGDTSKDNLAVFGENNPDGPKVLDTLYSRGYRDLDTARDYPNLAKGTSEERLGELGAPARFTIHTKVHSGEDGAHKPENIEKSIQASLDALKVSSVETIFLHLPDRATPLKDAAKAISDAVNKGQCKRFGISNYSPAEVQQFIDICDEHGYVKPSVYQGHYNPVVRGSEKELFPILRKNNISFFGFSPGAGGFFQPTAASAARWSSSHPVGGAYGHLYSDPAVHAVVETVQTAAAKHGINPYEATLRWSAFHGILDGAHGDGIIFAVSKLEQLQKSLDAIEAGPLPQDLADAISGVYAACEAGAPPFHF